jgi:hypothetical protein
MAKKKTESTEKSTKAEPKAKKPAAKEPTKAVAAKPAKPAKAAGSSGMPMFDTNLAAAAAARMLIARSKGEGDQNVSQTGSAIEQIKSAMSKGHGSGIGGVLDKSGPLGKRPNQPSNPMNQRGHNQTFGADVSRANVPRRTPG